MKSNFRHVNFGLMCLLHLLLWWNQIHSVKKSMRLYECYDMDAKIRNLHMFGERTLFSRTFSIEYNKILEKNLVVLNNHLALIINRSFHRFKRNHTWILWDLNFQDYSSKEAFENYYFVRGPCQSAATLLSKGSRRLVTLLNGCRLTTCEKIGKKVGGGVRYEAMGRTAPPSSAD